LSVVIILTPQTNFIMKSITTQILTFSAVLFFLGCSEDINMPTTSSKSIGLSPNYIMLIGAVPVDLQTQMSTIDAKYFETVSNYNQSVLNLPSALVINSDDVTNPDQLAHSSLIETIRRKGIPLVIGHNKDQIKQKHLVELLGGVVYEGSKLTMITQRGDTTAVTPVENQIGKNFAYLPMEELAIMILPNNVELISEDANIADEVTAANSVNSTNGVEKTNVNCFKNDVDLPNKFIDPYYPGHWRRIHSIEANRLSYHHVSKKLIRGSTLENQNAITNIVAGSGQITFRETTIYISERTYTTAWDFKVTATISATLGIGVSASTWYQQAQSEKTTVSGGFSVGKTAYTTTCTYACCDYIAQHALRNNLYEHKGKMIGFVMVNYGLDQPHTWIAQFKYCYNPTSNKIPIRYTKRGKSYIELMFYKAYKDCNEKSCNAAKTCSNAKPVKS
jgi:hypothetical protein